MLATDEKSRRSVVGNARPRIAPPRPARSLGPDWHQQANDMGIAPFPWQDVSAWYLYALGRGDAWLYREVLELVGRQNGKTEKLVPHIVKRLRMGRRVMHAAQNREVPREVFGRVADYIERAHPELLPSRRGRRLGPRFANGQEEIRLTNGGTYRIVAPTRGGARGPAVDDLILDEVRELDDHEFIAAAEPTLSASSNPQIYYLSSEGDEQSEVLNAIKARAGVDPALAFLSWSAAPERKADDLAGWREANPAIGHIPSKLGTLQAMYRKHSLAGTLAIFETEYLCRSVATLRDRLVDEMAWASLEAEDLGKPRMAYMGVALDPQGTRASAALAWRLPDARLALRLLLDQTANGDMDIDALGANLRTLQAAHRPRGVGYDPLTDAQLVRYLAGKAEPVGGQKHANASARFAGAVGSATIAWQDADAVTDDLVWTSRKPHDESGSFQAVRANDDRPITAALAAIRAVWLASGPPRGEARVW